MKITLLSLFCFLFTTVAIAQSDEEPTVMPVKGDFGMTLNLNGLINNISLNAPTDPANNQSLLFRYYLKDDLAIRAGFGATAVNRSWSRTDSVGVSLVELDSSYNKTDVYLAFGLEKHMSGSKRLDPYVGANLRIGMLGKERIKLDQQTTDTLGINSFKVDEDRSGGVSVGVDFTGGFNYFFSKRIAIGAEYSFGFSSTRNGGDWSRVTNDEPATGSSTVTREVGSDIVRAANLRVSSTGGITLSWFFAWKKEG